MRDPLLPRSGSIISAARLDCTQELPSCAVSVKDTTELRLFRKTDSFAPRPTVCLCPGLGSVVVAGALELLYAPPPGLQQSFTQCPVVPQFLQMLTSVSLALLVRVPF